MEEMRRVAASEEITATEFTTTSSPPAGDDIATLAELERSARAKADEAKAALAAAEARARAALEPAREADDTDEGTEVDTDDALEPAPSLVWRVGIIGDYMYAVHPAGIQIALGASAERGNFLVKAAPWTPVPADRTNILTRTQGPTRVDAGTGGQAHTSDMVPDELVHNFV